MIINIDELGTIEADVDVLNEMSIAFYHSSEQYRCVGLNALAKRHEAIRNSIYSQLDAMGVYDEHN